MIYFFHVRKLLYNLEAINFIGVFIHFIMTTINIHLAEDALSSTTRMRNILKHKVIGTQRLPAAVSLSIDSGNANGTSKRPQHLLILLRNSELNNICPNSLHQGWVWLIQQGVDRAITNKKLGLKALGKVFLRVYH